MSRFVWTDALDVGVSKMNFEHQRLIQLMGELQDLNQKRAGKDEICAAFEVLVDCVELHFMNEEAYLMTKNYPDLESHKLIHENLIKALNKHYREYRTSITNRVPSAVFDFFQSWLTTHILLVDKKYSSIEDE